MAGEIEAYAEAQAEFEAAQRALQQASEMIKRAGAMLSNNPPPALFSNTGVGLPMESGVMTDRFTIDGNQWASAKQIMEMVARFYESQDKVRRAWGAIPAAQRNILKAPAPR